MPETKIYIGTKVVRAWPSEKDGQAGYAINYADGYQSWSPKDIFERCYREVTADEKALM